jgi:thiamine-phosphate pyrophosphorylase
MTDSRMGDALWPAIARLPRGAGIIVRHYDLSIGERQRLFARLRRAAARRRLVVLRAGDDRLGRGEAGVHGRNPRRLPGIRSWPAHDAREVIAGHRAGADLIFISPLFATRSHPGARTLGRLGALRLKRLARAPVIALGGVDQGDERWLRRAGFYGWAGIDAWLD